MNGQIKCFSNIRMELYFLTCTIYQHILLMSINQSIIHVVFLVPVGSGRLLIVPDGF